MLVLGALRVVIRKLREAWRSGSNVDKRGVMI